MKPKMLFLIIGILAVPVVLVITLVLAFALELYEIKINEFNEIEFWYVEKGRSKKLDMGPKHLLAKFSKLEFGMTPGEVVELVGKPTDTEGFDYWWYRYKTGKDWYVKLLFGEVINNKVTLTHIHIKDYRGGQVFKLEKDPDPALCLGRAFFYSNGILTNTDIIDCPGFREFQPEQDLRWCPSGLSSKWTCTPPAQSTPFSNVKEVK